MMNLFDTLQKYDLISRQGVRSSTINSLSSKKIVDIAEQLAAENLISEENIKPSAFSHSASLSLGGSRRECDWVGCRASRLNELARFAVMYSDRVYIDNFFSSYIHYKGVDDNSLKEIFRDDITLIKLLKPLLENQSILLFTPREHLCPHSLAHRRFGPDADKRLHKEHVRLIKDYYLNMNVKIRKEYDEYEFLLEAPEPFLSHGNRVFVPHELTEIISSRPRIMSKINRGETVTLSQDIRRKLGFHRDFANDVVSNISYELAVSHLLRTSFLSDQTIHFTFLQSISNDAEMYHRNRIALEHLSSMVPFVEDVEIKNLIKLRKREEEAFIKYRRALNEAIDEFRSGKQTFTEKDALALHADVIAPSLASLEQKLQHAKKDLISKAARSVAAIAGTISFGLYIGFIPAEMLELAKAIGFTKLASDILEKTLALGDATKSIKQEDMYFLWRVKQKRKSHS